MAVCEMLEKCPFFNETMHGMPDHAELFKSLYCHGNHNMCARFMVYKSLGPQTVPADLFPNEIQRGNRLVASARKKKP